MLKFKDPSKITLKIRMHVFNLELCNIFRKFKDLGVKHFEIEINKLEFEENHMLIETH